MGEWLNYLGAFGALPVMLCFLWIECEPAHFWILVAMGSAKKPEMLVAARGEWVQLGSASGLTEYIDRANKLKVFWTSRANSLVLWQMALGFMKTSRQQSMTPSTARIGEGGCWFNRYQRCIRECDGLATCSRYRLLTTIDLLEDWFDRYDGGVIECNNN